MLITLFFYTRAKLEVESYRHFAGIFWWVLDPIIGVAVYYLMLKVFLNHQEDHYIQFLFIGIFAWKWFVEGITRSSAGILNNLTLIKKIRIQKYIFPLIEILNVTWRFLIMFSIMLIALYLFWFPLTIYALTIPLILLAQFIFIMGLGLFLSSFIPMFPDLQFLLGHALRLAFYPSCILFSAEKLPSQYQFVLHMNPIAGLVQSYRQVILAGRAPLWDVIGTAAIVGIFLGALGLFIINKYDKDYPKLI